MLLYFWHCSFNSVECSSLAHHRWRVISYRSAYISKFVERGLYKDGALYCWRCVRHCQVRSCLFFIFFVPFICKFSLVWSNDFPLGLFKSYSDLLNRMKLIDSSWIFFVALILYFAFPISICGQNWSFAKMRGNGHPKMFVQTFKMSLLCQCCLTQWTYYRHQYYGRGRCSWSCRIMVSIWEYSDSLSTSP